MDCISVSTLDKDTPIDVSAVQSLFFCIFPDFGEGLVETRRAFPGSGGLYRGVICDAVVLDDAFDGGEDDGSLGCGDVQIGTVLFSANVALGGGHNVCPCFCTVYGPQVSGLFLGLSLNSDPQEKDREGRCFFHMGDNE